MARGQQKVQSQQKAAEKAAKLKKQQGHSANDQKKAAQKALVHVCAVCKSQMPDPKTYKQHFENKHPKLEVPPELKEEAQMPDPKTYKQHFENKHPKLEVPQELKDI